jgi:hypothetical protein
MNRNTWWMLGGLVVLTVFGVQFNQISKLKREVALVRAELNGTALGAQPSNDGPVIIPSASAAIRPAGEGVGVAGIQVRLANLERTVGEFSKAADVLMDRGMIPPSEEKLAELQQKFFDMTLSDDERLKAFHMLRRNNTLSDEIVTQGLAMMQNSTNMNFKRAILQGFDGLTNSVLKEPLFAMLQSEGDNNTREQLVRALRKFTDDPTIEAALWDMALNDPHTGTRDRARDAVTRGGPVTPERVDRLAQTAQNPNASLDERLLSFRALRLAKAHTPEMVNEFAGMVQSTTDPVARAKLFQSFNGLTDPGLMAPLVNGLQDGDPIVRQRAVDALSSYGDPRVQEWLQHVVQNDTDPAVRREAHEALEHSQRMAKQQVGQ